MGASQGAWDVAAVVATEGMSDQGRRERLRHAWRFAAWCSERNIEPGRTDARQVDAYLESLTGTDRQLRTKARSSIRAVLRELDPEVAARASGLGDCTRLISAYAGTPTGALIRRFIDDGGKRAAVRKSGLTRLLAWCNEIAVEPTGLYLTDVIQFREWLKELNAFRPHTVGIAAKFIALRHSSVGRHVLREEQPKRRPLLIETAAPLAPRFALVYELSGGDSTFR